MPKVKAGMLFAALLVAVLVTVPGYSVAQTQDELAAINKKLNQIERQLRAVQRVAFPKGKMAQDHAAGRTGAEGGAGIDASSRVLLADIEVRLGRIDTQMRALTGSVEELAHKQFQLENKFENLRGDIEFRFRELAGGTDGAALARTSPSSGSADGGLVATPTPRDAEALLESQQRKDTRVAAPNNTPAAPAPVLPQGSPEDRYKFAFALLRKGDYPRAEAAFQAFLSAHADHRLAGNAQYWLGETYYVRKDYPRAAAAFLAGFQKYSKGAKGADSLVKLGLTLSNMGQNDDACAAFYEIEVSYPDASEAINKRAASEKARLSCQ